MGKFIFSIHLQAISQAIFINFVILSAFYIRISSSSFLHLQNKSKTNFQHKHFFTIFLTKQTNNS